MEDPKRHPETQSEAEREKQWASAGGMEGCVWDVPPPVLPDDAQRADPKGGAPRPVAERSEENDAETLTRGGNPADNLTATDLRAWERKALNRLAAGKDTDFMFGTDMPHDCFQFVRERIAGCTTPDEVRALFRAARGQWLDTGTAWQRKHHAPRLQNRRLAAEEHELVEPTDG